MPLTDPLNLPQGATALPLAGYPFFESRDPDEARAKVAGVYCDHRLDLIGDVPFQARHNRFAGKTLSLNVMQYGTKTLIAPGVLPDFYLFQMPLQGFASVTQGDDRHDIGPGRSDVLNPGRETRMIWGEGCVQMLVQIRRDALTAVARQHLGVPGSQLVQFRGPADLSGPAGVRLRALLGFVIDGAAQGLDPLGPASLTGAQIEHSLILALLETHRHNFSDRLEAPQGPSSAPRAVRLAESYMRDNLGAVATLDQIASAAGLSPRALQMAFRASRGRTPLEVLRDFRLERAWAELSSPTPDTTVTDVALQAGFAHLGRFAEQFRQKFGSTPVETLRSARRD